MNHYIIRKITEKDNEEIEKIVRDCLIEFHADHDGTAWSDPALSDLFHTYEEKGCEYLVCVNKDGKIVAGAGIGPLLGETGVCELQKMYCKKAFRGTGAAQKLLDGALDFAGKHYEKCYLETLENMERAQHFYERNGFYRIQKALGDTGHFSCDVRYLKKL